MTSNPSSSMFFRVKILFWWLTFVPFARAPLYWEVTIFHCIASVKRSVIPLAPWHSETGLFRRMRDWLEALNFSLCGRCGFFSFFCGNLGVFGNLGWMPGALFFPVRTSRTSAEKGMTIWFNYQAVLRLIMQKIIFVAPLYLMIAPRPR